MTRFFDTSALAKRYIAEAGSPLVRATLRAHAVAVARIAYAELAAGVARAARLGAIDQLQRDKASGQAVEFWSGDATLCAAAVAEGMKVVNPG